ncbi:hypothetical protein DFA_08649 [Cavenderia fasciculata]|uniref:NTF2-related export protein n=1 Tax=Cavenderia fasciculata TaxID=261658 RepID=F4Q3J5_CACFS|nr:uncharacterized protein DFA_08649 [Cavenderia fasciculata]EGG17653.1 hypothetical protein DFA_08649 [Cavenderia fasciculata]|eukprot:XP_004356137.1 hypothetical protein DFA_08649 [Cavenderia fasciculata]
MFTPNHKKESTEAEKVMMDLVFQSTQAAESFVMVLIKFYQENSVSIWNGTECKGVANIEKLLSELPQTAHTIDTYDAQPIYSVDKKLTNILITVSGKVVYAGTANHAFNQTLVLAKDPTTQNFYLAHDCVRLTS